MKRLCIIPCGAKKIWDKQPAAGPTRADQAYLSPFHQACQGYARAFFTDWLILSAKHGFLLPDDQVPGNYDVSFGSGHPETISAEQLRTQATEKGLYQFDQLVILGGKKFRPIVAAVFPQTPADFPLQGCPGIGKMLQRLHQAVASGQELSQSRT
ncbi:DUF6884 domain-containing protein [Brevibacillus fulvus]|uniref:DUF6884 domain-containing protein n=1 Tax=Brevibacillus fulvus TaxID=1125967 RepID=A0A938Y0C8_9BACL|nr:DUF6884 domain-containing protein [Brevibacillus fulvus]MBM7589716.1 hypothetical protein [Brevibacillus fulvus]